MIAIKSGVYRKCVANIPHGVFTPDGLPANHETAFLLGTALTGLEPVVQEYIRRGSDAYGYVHLPVSVTTCNGTGTGWRHPKAKMLRRFFSFDTNLRREISYSVRNVRSRASASMSSSEPTTFLDRVKKRPLSPATFKYDRAVGIEIECVGAPSEREVASVLPVWANRVSDGSLRAPSGQTAHEVRALLVRRELEPRLFRLCKTLNVMGLYVNSSCGLHVHLDMRGETEVGVVAKAKVADKWLKALVELVPASRRDNSYCKFGVVNPNSMDRYRAVNTTSFPKHKTLEIRLHSGTTDYTKILAWVRLLELLLALRKAPKPASCIATLEQLPLASHDLAYWRARHRELNPGLYSSVSTSEMEG